MICLLHPALRRLAYLKQRAVARRILRAAKSPGGAILLLLAVAAIVGFVALQIFAAVNNDNQLGALTGPAVTRFSPLAMALLTLITVFSSASERAIYFPPAEVEFLLGGPFSRKQLLVYKLSGTLFGAIFTATVLTLSLGFYLQNLLFAWIGSLLAILFINALALNASLLSQLVSAASYSLARRVLLAVVVVGVAVAVAQTLIASGANSPFAFLDFFYNTTAGSIVMAPFSVYGNIIGADNWLVVAIYAPIGVALNVALIALALRIDANYVDMALRVSQRVYERVQRARRTGSSAAGHVSAYWSAPQPPYWRGAGPIIWVGWTKLIRARYLVTMVSTVIVFMVVILVIITKGDSRLADRTPFLIVGALFYFTMLISIQAPIGFRSDIDQIAWLKSLPLRPLSVAWGQIAGLTIFLTIGGWLVLAVALPFGKHPEVIASGAALLGPYNLMMMAAENLMFLLYPARQAGTAPGDIQAIVRAFINMMLKGLVVALIALPSGAIGALLWMATGWFPSLPITVGLGFCAGGLLLVHATAVAYQRFDPSMDTPP